MEPDSPATSRPNGSASSKSTVPTTSAGGARASLIPKMPSRPPTLLSRGHSADDPVLVSAVLDPVTCPRPDGGYSRFDLLAEGSIDTLDRTKGAATQRLGRVVNPYPISYAFGH